MAQLQAQLKVGNAHAQAARPQTVLATSAALQAEEGARQALQSSLDQAQQVQQDSGSANGDSAAADLLGELDILREALEVRLLWALRNSCCAGITQHLCACCFAPCPNLSGFSCCAQQPRTGRMLTW